jgi:hypothetical protein
MHSAAPLRWIATTQENFEQESTEKAEEVIVGRAERIRSYFSERSPCGDGTEFA